jgi:hypothetical protein
LRFELRKLLIVTNLSLSLKTTQATNHPLRASDLFDRNR